MTSSVRSIPPSPLSSVVISEATPRSPLDDDVICGCPLYSDTQLNSTSSCRHVHSVNNCHLSMNVVAQLTQFVGYDVINKNTTDLLRADWLYAVQLGQLSWVDLCRYKRVLLCVPWRNWIVKFPRVQQLIRAYWFYFHKTFFVFKPNFDITFNKKRW